MSGDETISCYCPVCENRCSLKAFHCPRCGHPIGSVNRSIGLTWILIGFLSIGGTLAFALGAGLFVVGIADGGRSTDSSQWILGGPIAMFAGAVVHALAGIWKSLERIARR